MPSPMASPAVDRQIEFRTWLKNYYPEGWHQSPGMLELMINLKTWETLTAAQRVQIETVCGDNVRYSLAEGEAIQFRAVKELFAEGVRLARLPPSIHAALERAWQQVVQQRAVDDPGVPHGLAVARPVPRRLRHLAGFCRARERARRHAALARAIGRRAIVPARSLRAVPGFPASTIRARRKPEQA